MPHFIRETIRSWRARPLTTAAAIVIVALGVGSATAVSTGVYTLPYRSLPLPRSERLVSGFALREGFDPFGTSLLEFSTFRSRVRWFEASGLARQQTSTVRIGGETVRVQSAAVTADYLTTVGVSPMAGRGVMDSDDRPGGPAVASSATRSGFVASRSAPTPSAPRSRSMDGRRPSSASCRPDSICRSRRSCGSRCSSRARRCRSTNA